MVNESSKILSDRRVAEDSGAVEVVGNYMNNLEEGKVFKDGRRSRYCPDSEKKEIKKKNAKAIGINQGTINRHAIRDPY